jgi:hypothetical protein
MLNLAAIVVAFVILLDFQQYSSYAFYGLLSWILVSFVLLYAFRVGRSSPSAGSLAGASTPSGGVGAMPLPSGPSSGPTMTLDFCIYCGTALSPGVGICSACGHPVRAL